MDSVSGKQILGDLVLDIMAVENYMRIWTKNVVLESHSEDGEVRIVFNEGTTNEAIQIFFRHGGKTNVHYWQDILCLQTEEVGAVRCIFVISHTGVRIKENTFPTIGRKASHNKVTEKEIIGVLEEGFCL